MMRRNHTWNKNISIMGDEVLQNLFRAVNDIDIAPIHPRMFWFQRSSEEVVSCPAKSLAPRALGLEGVPVLHVLAQVEMKVLLDDLCASERYLVGTLLDAIQLSSQDGECIVLRV